MSEVESLGFDINSSSTFIEVISLLLFLAISCMENWKLMLSAYEMFSRELLGEPNETKAIEDFRVMTWLRANGETFESKTRIFFDMFVLSKVSFSVGFRIE